MGLRLQDWFRFATSRPKSRTKALPIDRWFRSALSRATALTRTAMEAMEYRSALRHGYFDLQAAWSWYLRRSRGVPHARLRRRFVEAQTKFLAPFAPHVAEEVWRRLGGRGFVSASAYPEAKPSEIDEPAEAAERYLRATIDDVREILKVTALTPKRVVLYAAPAWKWRAYAKLVSLASAGPLDLGGAMRGLMEDPQLRARGGDVNAPAKKVVPEVARLGRDELKSRAAPFDERAYLAAAKEFLSEELRARVDVFEADASGVDDPKGRAHGAIPWRPAIYVE